METGNKEFIFHQSLTQNDYEKSIKLMSNWAEKKKSYKHRVTHSLLLLSFVLFLLSLFILLAIIFLSNEREAHPIIKLFSYFTASLTVLSILLSLAIVKIKNHPSDAFPIRVKIIIKNDGIYGETENSSSSYTWHAISHINKTDDFLFLIANHLTVLPISLSNFYDEQEVESLTLFIEERMGNPKGAS